MTRLQFTIEIEPLYTDPVYYKSIESSLESTISGNIYVKNILSIECKEV